MMGTLFCVEVLIMIVQVDDGEWSPYNQMFGQYVVVRWVATVYIVQQNAGQCSEKEYDDQVVKLVRQHSVGLEQSQTKTLHDGVLFIPLSAVVHDGPDMYSSAGPADLIISAYAIGSGTTLSIWPFKSAKICQKLWTYYNNCHWRCKRKHVCDFGYHLSAAVTNVITTITRFIRIW